MAFVLDNSVTMAWCFEDERNEYALSVLARLRGEEAVAPTIWPLEVVNVLLVAERRRRLHNRQIMDVLEELATLAITVDEEGTTRAWGPLVALARAHVLTAYDASYLELAMRLRLPLATLDQRLRAAAIRAGVALVD